MANNLEGFASNMIRKTIATQYPHLVLPAVLLASVVSAKKLDDTFDLQELVICNDESGGSYRGHITANWYEYALKVVDQFGNPDEGFPLIPGVRSRLQLKAGALAAISLPNGALDPAIIGEVTL